MSDAQLWQLKWKRDSVAHITWQFKPRAAEMTSYLLRSQHHLPSSSCRKSTLSSKFTFLRSIISTGKELCSHLPHINSRKVPWRSVPGSYAHRPSRVSGVRLVRSKCPFCLSKEKTIFMLYGGDVDCRGSLQRNQKRCIQKYLGCTQIKWGFI